MPIRAESQRRRNRNEYRNELVSDLQQKILVEYKFSSKMDDVKVSCGFCKVPKRKGEQNWLESLVTIESCNPWRSDANTDTYH